MARVKSLFDQFSGLIACIAVLISIVGFFKEDAAARTRNGSDIEMLKKIAPEERFDRIEMNIAVIMDSNQRLRESIEKLQSSVDRLNSGK